MGGSRGKEHREAEFADGSEFDNPVGPEAGDLESRPTVGSDVDDESVSRA